MILMQDLFPSFPRSQLLTLAWVPMYDASAPSNAEFCDAVPAGSCGCIFVTSFLTVLVTYKVPVRFLRKRRPASHVLFRSVEEQHHYAQK